MMNETQLEESSIVNEIKVETLNMIQDYLTMLIKAKKNLSDSKYIPVQETIRGFLKVFPALSL